MKGTAKNRSDCHNGGGRLVWKLLVGLSLECALMGGFHFNFLKSSATEQCEALLVGAKELATDLPSATQWPEGNILGPELQQLALATFPCQPSPNHNSLLHIARGLFQKQRICSWILLEGPWKHHDWAFCFLSMVPKWFALIGFLLAAVHRLTQTVWSPKGGKTPPKHVTRADKQVASSSGVSNSSRGAAGTCEVLEDTELPQCRQHKLAQQLQVLAFGYEKLHFISGHFISFLSTCCSLSTGKRPGMMVDMQNNKPIVFISNIPLAMLFFRAPFFGLYPQSWSRASWAVDMALLALASTFLSLEMSLVMAVAPEHMRFDPHPVWRMLMIYTITAFTAAVLTVWDKVASWQQVLSPHAAWPGLVHMAIAELSGLSRKLGSTFLSLRSKSERRIAVTGQDLPADDIVPARDKHSVGASAASLLPFPLAGLQCAVHQGSITISLPGIDPEQLPADWKERLQEYLRERHPNLVLTGCAVWKGSTHIQLDLAYIPPPRQDAHEATPVLLAARAAMMQVAEHLEPHVLGTLLGSQGQVDGGSSVGGGAACVGSFEFGGGTVRVEMDGQAMLLYARNRHTGEWKLTTELPNPAPAGPCSMALQPQVMAVDASPSSTARGPQSLRLRLRCRHVDLLCMKVVLLRESANSFMMGGALAQQATSVIALSQALMDLPGSAHVVPKPNGSAEALFTVPLPAHVVRGGPGTLTLELYHMNNSFRPLARASVLLVAQQPLNVNEEQQTLPGWAAEVLACVAHLDAIAGHDEKDKDCGDSNCGIVNANACTGTANSVVWSSPNASGSLLLRSMGRWQCLKQCLSLRADHQLGSLLLPMRPHHQSQCFPGVDNTAAREVVLGAAANALGQCLAHGVWGAAESILADVEGAVSEAWPSHQQEPHEMSHATAPTASAVQASATKPSRASSAAADMSSLSSAVEAVLKELLSVHIVLLPNTRHEVVQLPLYMASAHRSQKDTMMALRSWLDARCMGLRWTKRNAIITISTQIQPDTAAGDSAGYGGHDNNDVSVGEQQVVFMREARLAVLCCLRFGVAWTLSKIISDVVRGVAGAASTHECRVIRQAASQVATQQALLAAVMTTTMPLKLLVHVWRGETCGVVALVPFIVVMLVHFAASVDAWGLQAPIQAHTQAITAGMILSRTWWLMVGAGRCMAVVTSHGSLTRYFFTYPGWIMALALEGLFIGGAEVMVPRTRAPLLMFYSCAHFCFHVALHLYHSQRGSSEASSGYTLSAGSATFFSSTPTAVLLQAALRSMLMVGVEWLAGHLTWLYAERAVRRRAVNRSSKETVPGKVKCI